MTGTRPDDVLIERIRKMHAKAESAKQLGSEAEALIFASAVQKLLLKHNLEMSDVEALAAEKEDPVKGHFFYPEQFGLPRSKRRQAWTMMLAGIVARAHLCQSISMVGSNRFILVGTHANRQAAEFMLVFLTRYAVSHSEQDYVKFFYKCKAEGDVTRAQGYKQGWLMGFVGRINQRYEMEQRETIAEITAGSKNLHALIRLKDQLVRVKEVVDKLSDDDIAPPQGRKLEGDGVMQGMADGLEHGDKAQLRGLDIAQPDKTKGLSRGQKMLGSGD